ncbi:hypothetical protein ACLMJK_003794 [Lecanora helva]
MAPSSPEGLTIRIRGLPPETIANDVRRFFDSRIGPSGSVISKNGIGRIIVEAKRRTKQTTVTFANPELKKKAVDKCNRNAFSAEQGDGTMVVDVEDEFMGLTTLYEPASGSPNLDIVALHGLSGHAWNSFASAQGSREGVKETCWLRDELPIFLEGQNKGIRPRVMTFGYHANIWINSTIDGLESPVADLIHSLKVERDDPTRPLIFIGHSLGGIVIKQVVDEMITSNKQRNPRYSTPIKACLFLAVPHRGTGNANTLDLFLTVLKKALLPGMGPNKKFVKDLELKNKRLADITDRFIQLLNGNRIEVISCYENRDYAPGKGKIVSKESATLDYGNRLQLPRPIDANHTDCARFGSASQHPFVEIASELADFASSAIDDLRNGVLNAGVDNGGGGPSLGPTQTPSTHARDTNVSKEPVERGVEPVYYKLTRYVTVFLVDDSTSMEDIPEAGISLWSDTINALTECARLILGARGRLKVHFFNSPKTKESISGTGELQELCRFTPRGDTPTYERLKQHLDEFIMDYEPLDARGRAAYPGLNLVIFTDGAPEGPFEDIKEVIVETAQDLDRFRADKYKLGIQFVQIGDDQSVANFFDHIDNEIKKEHGLKRDIVDTVRYDPKTADEKKYKQIVLGAIDKNQDNLSSAASTPSVNNHHLANNHQVEMGPSSAAR